jgi:hypothetical protein
MPLRPYMAPVPKPKAPAPTPKVEEDPRDHVPIGSDVELQKEIAEGAGEGGAQALSDLTDVTGDPAPGLGPVYDAGGVEAPLTRVVTQEDLDAILVTVAEVTWRPLVLQNGCVASPSPYAPPRYRLTLNNLVFLQGRVTKPNNFASSDTGLVIATLDTDARPGGGLVYIAPGGTAATTARVVVHANGQITFEGLIGGTTPASAISLAPIIFSVEGPSAELAAAMQKRFVQVAV